MLTSDYWSYVYFSERSAKADDSSTRTSSSATHTEQSRMGGEKGCNAGKGKTKQQQQQQYNLRPRNQTVTRNKTPLVEANTIEGLDIQVTWLLHDEKTQIHIAFAEFKRAEFDVVILPVKVNMTGIDVFSEECINRNYGSLLSRPKTQLNSGQVKSCEKSKDFACKNIVIGILYDYNKTDRNKDLIHKLMDNAINKIPKKASTYAVGIPVQFDGVYDPIDLIHSIMEIRSGVDKKQLHCYLCCKRTDTDTDLKPFMKRVDEVIHQYESPKRFANLAFKDNFRMVDVSVEIEMKGILDTRCECIVAAIGGKFQLDRGTLTQTIANGAGHALQQEVNKVVKQKNYQQGDIIECNPGNLSQDGMKSILFGQLSKWVPEQNKELGTMMSTFVKECLVRADRKGCVSVAFPALGSGYLNYPDAIIVRSILGGVEKYATTEMNGIVSRVVIAYHGADSNSLYDKFVSEISKHAFNKNKPERLASPGNDGMNAMLAEYESKGNGISETSPSIGERSPKPVKADQSSDESINDTREMFFGDMTAEVNPGITKYFKDKNLIENFNTCFTEQFGVQIVGNGDKIALRGSLENIINAEKFLNDGLFNESMFQKTNNGEAAFLLKDKTKPIKTSEGCDTPGQEPKRVSDTTKQEPNEVNNVAEAFESEENICKKQPISEPKLPRSPDDINVCRHNILDISLHIFECKNMFSFETDIKVVTTALKAKENMMDKSKFLHELLEKIPECQKAWDTWTNKSSDRIDIDNLNKQVDTCNYVMVVDVPYINKPIQHKNKHEFKEHVRSTTRKILEKAVDMKVESITLPILVHSDVENAIDMCLDSMAEIIFEYMHKNTSLKHFNVIVEKHNVGKKLSAKVKEVKRK